MDTGEERRKEQKAKSASYGHVKRCISNNEPLSGKTLEVALDLVNVQGEDKFSRFVRNIGVKLKAAQPLDEYEYHILVDVLMLHVRIGG